MVDDLSRSNDTDEFKRIAFETNQDSLYLTVDNKADKTGDGQKCRKCSVAPDKTQALILANSRDLHATKNDQLLILS